MKPVQGRIHGAGCDATRSCITPVSSSAEKTILTIEGPSADASHPVQKAWLREEVSQCGYCQPGQIMNAAALLKRNPNPGDDDINAAMGDILCRCGTYQRIRAAIHRAAAMTKAPVGTGAPARRSDDDASE